jgi:hypothetical protein
VSDSRPLVISGIALAIGVVAMWLGFETLSIDRLIFGVAGIVLFALVFLRTEFGLYVVVFSMLLSPEFSLAGGLAERREAAIRVEDLLLVVIGMAWLAKTAINKEVGLVAKTPLNRPIAFYIGSQLIATLIGMVAGSVKTATGIVYVTKYVEYFVVYYMVVNNVDDRKHAWRLVAAAFMTAAIVSANGLAQIPRGVRVSAPFEGDVGEPNTFGGYLLMMLAVATGLAFQAQTIRLKAMYAGLVGIMFLPFLFTLSRSSYLGAIPMMLTLFVLFPKRRIVLALLFAAGVFVAVVAPPEAVEKRVRYTMQGSGGGIGLSAARLDSSTQERLESYEAAFEAWMSSPVIGRGVTGFRFIDAQYPRLLAESGVLGFGAFCWLIFSLLHAVAQVYKTATDPMLRGLAGGFIAAIFGILVHAVGSNSFIIIRIMEPFWLFAAVIIMMPTLPEEEKKPERPAQKLDAWGKPLPFGAR